jgi:hypothetical protein
MTAIKELRGFTNLRLRRFFITLAMAMILLSPVASIAQSCVAPARPFVPSDSQAALDYADIIRGDFENYIQDIQSYFRCLDSERARAFEEAREVSEDYGRFLQLVGD